VKLSCTVITLGEPTLEAAIASVRGHVDEMVIVYTGNDDETWRRVAALADRAVTYRNCNDDNGEIADFSRARNRALELAGHDAVVWLDSDDIVEGAEHWRAIVAEHEHAELPVRILAPYHYGYDEAGAVNCVHWRERIVLPRHRFEWVRAWHEGLVLKGGGEEGKDYKNVFDNRSVWKHAKRDFTASYERNVRIARRQADLYGEDDPRTLYDYAMALADDGEVREAVERLTRYVGMSGKKDECAQALLRLAVLTGSPQDLETPKAWIRQAIELEPHAFAPHFMLARIELLEAYMGREGAAAACLATCEAAVKASGDSLVPHNPHDRAVGIYEVAHVAAALAEVPSPIRPASDAENDASLLLLAHAPPKGGLDIVFVCGDAGEAWNPEIARTVGAGGSETAVMAMAAGLAGYGHRVRVYGPCGREGLYGGVEYRFIWRIDATEQVDVLVAWRNASLLEAMPAQRKWLWLHDSFIHRASPYWISLADQIVCLSRFHAGHIILTTKGVDEKRVWVTRNGIDLARFAATDVPRDPHKVIWSSSPDRGLDLLLDMWPAIRAAVPDASLHVFYGFERTERAAKVFNMGAMQKATEALRKRAAGMAGEGVVLRGRVDQQTLAREMLSAGAVLYPSWAVVGDPTEAKFYETSWIGGMESTAAGLHIVAPTWGAIPETAAGHAHLLHFKPGETVDARGPEFQEMFIDAAVAALTDTSDRAAVQERARRFAWGAVISEWEQKMRDDILNANIEQPLIDWAEGETDEMPAFAGVLEVA
jgi:glycosyltransferase involved in cell wall biosynthesis